MKTQALSKKEAKYRNKFIQEYHYDKFEQKQLDMAKKDLKFPYKQIYLDAKRGFVYTFMIINSMNRANKAISKAGVSLKKAVQSMANTFANIQ